MATTPPPGLLREPPAPKHGAAYDSYEPYPSRQSERIARQKLNSRSASPPLPASPQKAARQRNAGTLSPPTSRSPRKLVRGQALLPDDGSQSGLSRNNTASPSKHSRATTLLPPDSTASSLPTPAKTPNSKRSHPVTNLGNVARSLFPAASPNRAKKSKSSGGYSLESFDDSSEGNNNRIEIYTDSRDRVPTVNKKPDNLFIKQSAPTMPSSTEPVLPKRRKLASSATPEPEPKDAVNRDDGMLYTFRGKKVFRKFDEKDDREQSDDEDLGLFVNRPDLLDGSVNLHVPRITRSAIKGRVLFPSNSKTKTEEVPPPSHNDDEEATTDIDEQIEPADDDDNDGVVAPPKEATEETPPRRSLRSRRLSDGVTPHIAAITETQKRGTRGSPFDIWKRKKQSPPAASAPKKREADGSPVTTAPVAKKTRGN